MGLKVDIEIDIWLPEGENKTKKEEDHIQITKHSPLLSSNAALSYALFTASYKCFASTGSEYIDFLMINSSLGNMHSIYEPKYSEYNKFVKSKVVIPECNAVFLASGKGYDQIETLRN